MPIHATVAQSSEQAAFTSEIVGSILATDSCEKCLSTPCRKSWVFSGCSESPPPPQGKLAGWAGLEISVREPSDKMFDDFEFGSDICIVMCDGL
jgi:hypothetical protein